MGPTPLLLMVQISGVDLTDEGVKGSNERDFSGVTHESSSLCPTLPSPKINSSLIVGAKGSTFMVGVLPFYNCQAEYPVPRIFIRIRAAVSLETLLPLCHSSS